MKPPVGMYAFLVTFVLLPFALGLRAPVTLPSVVGIVLAGAMVWRGYRWAWGILVAFECVSLAVAVMVTVFRPDVATIVTALLGVASVALLFAPGVLRYLDRWDDARSRQPAIR